MKITKKEFANEINFRDVEVSQVFHYETKFYMAFGKEVEDDEDFDITYNAICLNDGQLVHFDYGQLVAVVDNVELIVAG